jgi:hypothetical protein
MACLGAYRLSRTLQAADVIDPREPDSGVTRNGYRMTPVMWLPGANTEPNLRVAEPLYQPLNSTPYLEYPEARQECHNGRTAWPESTQQRSWLAIGMPLSLINWLNGKRSESSKYPTRCIISSRPSRSFHCSSLNTTSKVQYASQYIRYYHASFAVS